MTCRDGWCDGVTEHALLFDIQWCENQETNSCSDDEEYDLLEEDELIDELGDGFDFTLATTESQPEPEPPAWISIEEMLIRQQSNELWKQVRDEIHSGKETLFFENEDTRVLSRNYRECVQVVVPRS